MGDFAVDRTERRRPAPPSSRYGNEGEVAARDAPLLETPAGRENDHGAGDPRSAAADAVRRKDVGATPRSAITGRHDPGTGANETRDGLDATGEDLRRAAEDRPTGGGREDRPRETPVFERGLTSPKT